jgi:hypothetical protein
MAVPCKLVLFNFFYNCLPSPICCLVVTFLILSFLDILEDFLGTYISVASTRLLLFSVSFHVSEPKVYELRYTNVQGIREKMEEITSELGNPLTYRRFSDLRSNYVRDYPTEVKLCPSQNSV